jgi:hypothetical protein
MLSRLHTALKFMTYGVLIGILFAPDSGAQTRQKIYDWANSSVRGLIGNVTGDRGGSY